MVKSVIGDENQLKLVEDRLARSAAPSQIGLVIGKLNSKLDRGFVYDLVPTPPNDAGEQPCSVIDGAGDSSRSKKKGSSKSKSHSESSALFIDHDWVFEHARQVPICDLKPCIKNTIGWHEGGRHLHMGQRRLVQELNSHIMPGGHAEIAHWQQILPQAVFGLVISKQEKYWVLSKLHVQF